MNTKYKNRIIGKETKYINTAILIPVVEINKEPNFLFQIRSSNIRQGDEICFPGGKVDYHTDRNSKETAIRETVEELGIEKNKIEILASLGTLVAPMGVSVDVYYGKLLIFELDELNINKDEVKDVFCIPIKWFKNNSPLKYSVRIEVQPHFIKNNEKEVYLPVKDLDLPDRYLEPWGGSKIPIYVYKTNYGTIWGITAEIVLDTISFI